MQQPGIKAVITGVTEIAPDSKAVRASCVFTYTEIVTDSGRRLSTSYRAGVQWVCGTYLLLCLIKNSGAGTHKHPSYEGLLPKSPLD